MDGTLRELERVFLEGGISLRELFRRAALLLASTTTAFELLGRLSPRRVAEASPGCITLDLSTTDLAGQGYARDGNQPFSVDTAARRLTITDGASNDRCFLIKACPEIPTSELSVDVTLRIDANGLAPRGDNTGVHVALIEGNAPNGITGREIRVVCVSNPPERRLAPVTSSGGLSPGTLYDWLVEQQFRVTRNAFGDATIQAGALSETMVHDRLAPSSLDTAVFALGCALNEANAIAVFGPIGEPAPAQITPTLVQLFPNGAEKVALRPHFLSGTRIYPVDGTDFMPIGFEAMAGGWRITAAEKQRTGIQDFEILQTGDPSFFVFKLVDTRTGLPSADYHSVCLSLEIGDDRGSTDMSLVENNGKWTLA